MCYASSGVRPTVRLGSLSTGLGRAAGGESLFQTVWKNSTSADGFIGVTSSRPSSLLAVDVSTIDNGTLLCRRGSFLCALSPSTVVGAGMQQGRTCLACCCSGIDLVMQQISGGNWVLLQAHGTLIQKTLARDERIVVDSASVVALASSVTVDVRCAGGCRVLSCGGEGCYNTVLQGPGMIVLTSMSLDKLRRIVLTNLVTSGSPDVGQTGAGASGANEAGGN